MTASELYANDILPLRTTDTGADALEVMHEFYVQHLPIVNDGELLAIVSEDDVLEHDVERALGEYATSLPQLRIRTADHLYEVMRTVAQYDLTAVPVVEADGRYVGLITAADLLNYYARTATFTENGSIVILEVQRRDYALSEIARIAESENAIILSSFVEASGDGSLLQVTIKVNHENVAGMLNTFQRFGYEVQATFNEGEALDSMRERYDALMNYLSV